MRRVDHRCWLAGLAILVAACSGPSPDGPAGPADSQAESRANATPLPDRPARALPLPGAEELPAGHPPVAEGAPRRLLWDVPDGWTEVPPTSRMRLAEYRIPGPGGDASLAVFYFGPGQGGDPMSNAERWAAQFEQPDGGSSVERMQVSELALAIPVRLVEVRGTYDGGMTMTAAPPQKQEGWMLLGAIAEGPDAPWFFKLTGPEDTVHANRDRMLAMMKSLRAGAASGL